MLLEFVKYGSAASHFRYGGMRTLTLDFLGLAND